MSGDLFPFNLTDNAWGIHEIIHNDLVKAIEASIVHLPTGHVLALFREEVDSESARRQAVFETLSCYGTFSGNLNRVTTQLANLSRCTFVVF